MPYSKIIWMFCLYPVIIHEGKINLAICVSYVNFSVYLTSISHHCHVFWDLYRVSSNPFNDASPFKLLFPDAVLQQINKHHAIWNRTHCTMTEVHYSSNMNMTIRRYVSTKTLCIKHAIIWNTLLKITNSNFYLIGKSKNPQNFHIHYNFAYLFQSSISNLTLMSNYSVYSAKWRLEAKQVPVNTTIRVSDFIWKGTYHA